MKNKQSFNPLTKEQYNSIKKGDTVVRMLAFCIPIDMLVTEVTEDKIILAHWEFDRNTGIEIDEDISVPVSYISEIKSQ